MDGDEDNIWPVVLTLDFLEAQKYDRLLTILKTITCSETFTPPWSHEHMNPKCEESTYNVLYCYVLP